ncbi:MAG: MBL fold metallo-hydrolase [archaeon]
MRPRILFLGTGGDAQVVGAQSRASGALIIQMPDNQFVIDPGPGTLNMAKAAGINLRETTAVFVSHNHLNHANDINAVISAMTHGGLDPRGVLVAAKSVIGNGQAHETFLCRHYLRFIERAIQIEAEQRLGINTAEILVTRAHHTDESAVGFKFFTDKFTLGYTGDTNYTKELAQEYKETDIMVLCVKHAAGENQEGNLNVDDATKLIGEIDPKLAIITHFGVKLLDSDPLDAARTIQKSTKVQTIVATDGLAINPVSYSAGLRTKTLNLYRD